MITRKDLIRTDYLPALPGFFRLEPWLDGDKLAVVKKAIVGWRVRTYAPAHELDDAHTQADPIVMLGEVNDMDANAILRPDGMVEHYDLIELSYEAWHEHVLAELIADEMRKQAKANDA